MGGPINFLAYLLPGFLVVFILAILLCFVLSKVFRYNQRSLKGFVRTGIRSSLIILVLAVFVSIFIGIVSYAVDGFWQLGLVFLIAVGGSIVDVFGGYILGFLLSYIILPIKEQ
ncbi:MAG: hypothetical protein UT37_C0009G0018 [Parcubacteria group bacterium GW2011_GWA2_39_18]|nr:MAG: hypothetical protein UT37_C0009G0018 [Parcubacteria group bacterium GW2011_GWA2_39_18]